MCIIFIIVIPLNVYIIIFFIVYIRVLFCGVSGGGARIEWREEPTCSKFNPVGGAKRKGGVSNHA